MVFRKQPGYMSEPRNGSITIYKKNQQPERVTNDVIQVLIVKAMFHTATVDVLCLVDLSRILRTCLMSRIVGCTSARRNCASSASRSSATIGFFLRHIACHR